MNAEIIAIGDEITSGQNLDTNSQWLSQRLEELGVRVLYHTTVGDELAPNVEVFRHAMERADVIVATGGLGPTADDLTREALATATGRPLELDAEALEHIRRLFASRRRPMPESNRLQAMFPAGSRVVRNPHGTAPGIDMEVARDGRPPCRVICLPGVPAEMMEMWRDSVGATIGAFAGGGRVIRRRLVHCFGAGESQIEAMLPDLIRRGRRPMVGITASKATITLRITADGESEEECLAAIAPVEATIRECLGRLVFGAGDDQLEDVVVRLLGERGKTLATAECGTAGLLAAWLSGAEQAAGVYRGGWVLTQSDQSAEALAADCREKLAADYGLAVNFSAASGSGSGGGEPTAICVAVASADGGDSKAFPSAIHPALSHIFRAKQALNYMRLSLSDAIMAG
jgi:nicotinamide-nucleotide amidase